MSITVNLQNPNNFPCPDLVDFEQWANLCLARAYPQAEISIKLVTPDEMAKLNDQYRQKPKPTNILAFSYDLDLEENPPYIGDLVICPEVLTQEAGEIHSHWAHITLHGLLHLLGYDHQTNSEAQIMEAKEILLLNQLGHPNPYET